MQVNRFRLKPIGMNRTARAPRRSTVNEMTRSVGPTAGWHRPNGSLRDIGHEPRLLSMTERFRRQGRPTEDIRDPGPKLESNICARSTPNQTDSRHGFR